MHPAGWPSACYHLVAVADWCHHPEFEVLEVPPWWTRHQDFRLHGGVGRGIFIRYDQQLVEGRRLVAEEFVLEEGAFSAPGSKVLDSLHLVHALAGVPKLGPAREVVAC